MFSLKIMTLKPINLQIWNSDSISLS